MSDKAGLDLESHEQAPAWPRRLCDGDAAEPDFHPVPLPARDIDDGPEGPRSIAIHWLATAATLLIFLLAIPGFAVSGADPHTVRTTASEDQTIALADGSIIALSGGTELVLDRNNARVAELVSGDAHFTVAHHAAQPFIVTVGEDRLIARGTVFRVLHEDGRLHVDVVAGALRYAGLETIDLAAGDTLRGADNELMTLPDCNSRLPAASPGGIPCD